MPRPKILTLQHEQLEIGQEPFVDLLNLLP